MHVRHDNTYGILASASHAWLSRMLTAFSFQNQAFTILFDRMQAVQTFIFTTDPLTKARTT